MPGGGRLLRHRRRGRAPPPLGMRASAGQHRRRLEPGWRPGRAHRPDRPPPSRSRPRGPAGAGGTERDVTGDERVLALVSIAHWTCVDEKAAMDVAGRVPHEPPRHLPAIPARRQTRGAEPTLCHGNHGPQHSGRVEASPDGLRVAGKGSPQPVHAVPVRARSPRIPAELFRLFPRAIERGVWCTKPLGRPAVAANSVSGVSRRSCRPTASGRDSPGRGSSLIGRVRTRHSRGRLGPALTPFLGRADSSPFSNAACSSRRACSAASSLRTPSSSSMVSRS